ncbi:hypothetical protein N7470_006915 [Penicillium chermesinum]|nr:hypothetical protein N7470_006915 [Penicillium chermesinum]
MAEQYIEVDPDPPEPCQSHEPNSETTSLAASIYHGVTENGRRYQTTREGDYWGPCDAQQFESQEVGHTICQLLDTNTDNQFFQAPVEDPKHILDMGTGKGSWAVDVADRYPDAIIRGVDLYPPPTEWVPPNCYMEVEDLLLSWTWRSPFDLIHLRFMTGSWTPEDWNTIYKRCYDNLAPEGWIEQLEIDPQIRCDDDSLPPNASIRYLVAATTEAGSNWNHHLDTSETMRASIENAGFIDIREKSYRWAIGPWLNDARSKEAGRLHYYQWLSGMEGWVLRFLTQWARPEPWTQEEVQALLDKVREELGNPEYHMYQNVRRVWARKPTEAEFNLRETEIITLDDLEANVSPSRHWWWR